MANPKTKSPPKSKKSNENPAKEVGSHITKKVDGNLLKFSDALPQAKTTLADGLQQLTATLAMRDLTPSQVRDVFDYSSQLKDAVESAREFARARILDIALTSGEPTGPTGASRRIVYGDGTYTLAKATKTGTDPKKFEAALRAKSIEVVKYMVPDIKYKMPSDYDAIKQAIDDGVFTADEVKTMAYEPSYAVERSKEGKGE